MCLKGVAASVSESLKFLYWITGLSLTWNFEIWEICIYSHLQCLPKKPRDKAGNLGWWESDKE